MLTAYHSSIGNLSAGHPLIRLALLYHRIHNGTKEGGALSFQEMPFLVEIYRDLPTLDEMVAKKCTQIGWTESQLVYAIHQAAERGRRWAYVLPHDGLLSTFIQERVQPMFDRVAYYETIRRAGWRAKQAQNMRLLHVGSGSWRWVGSRNAANFREWAADSITVDEVDDCNQANLPMVRDRLRASGAPQLFWLANPKLPTGGISRMFEASDRREWYHRCGRCGERQRIEWFENVVEQGEGGAWLPRDRDRWKLLTSQKIKDPGPAMDIRPVCRRCRRPWNRSADGCWVSENPDHPRRGYHACQMDHLGRSIWKMYVEYIEALDDPDALAIWWGSVLGLLLEAKGQKLTVNDLRGCIRENYEMVHNPGEELKKQTIVAGVDVGAVLQMTISMVETRHEDPSDKTSAKYTVRKAIWVGAMPTFEEVRDKLKDYHVDIAVVDAGPELHKAQELRDYCNGNTRTRVYLCYYAPTPKADAMPFGMKIKALAFTVTVDKTAVMDVTLKEIRQGRREFPSDVNLVLHWSEHMRAPTRVLDEKGNRFKWDRGNKRDDYRQAECYERIAFELLTAAGGYYEISL